jgi:hypothetical protein
MNQIFFLNFHRGRSNPCTCFFHSKSYTCTCEVSQQKTQKKKGETREHLLDISSAEPEQPTINVMPEILRQPHTPQIDSLAAVADQQAGRDLGLGRPRRSDAFTVASNRAR